MYKAIIGFEGKYSVDEKGDVYSHIKCKVLKPALNSGGYPTVVLCRHTKSVHRLVAEAFLPNYIEKPQVNHIDGDKTNNHASNLEMVTASENQIHAITTGLRPVGEQRSWSKLSNEDVASIKLLILKGGESQTSIGRRFGVHHTTISDIKLGYKWSHIKSI